VGEEINKKSELGLKILFGLAGSLGGVLVCLIFYWILLLVGPLALKIFFIFFVRAH
jgi:hypothetical protein